MKKICFVIPNLKTGGANRVFIELANELATKNCVTEVIYPMNTTDKNTFAISDLVKTTSIGKRKKGNLGKIWNLVYLLIFVSRNRSGHKVVISDPFISILFLLFPKRNLVRYVQGDDYEMFDDRFIIKSPFLLYIYKKLVVLSYQKDITFLFNSQHSYTKFIVQSKRSDISKAIIHPGLNPFFKDRYLRVWNSKINICIMARKHPLKGFADFIAAWNQVRPQLGQDVETIYVISHDDLDSFDTKDFARITPASDEDIAITLNHSHLFVSTSLNEGFGLPPLEAMSCGCACIIANSGGVLEYAKDRENCLMYTPKNIDELASLLTEAIQNVQLLKTMATHGKLTAKRFSVENTATAFLDYMTQTGRKYAP